MLEFPSPVDEMMTSSLCHHAMSLSTCTGLLHPGHVIHEINGRSLAGYSVNDVADLMVRVSGGSSDVCVCVSLA